MFVLRHMDPGHQSSRANERYYCNNRRHEQETRYRPFHSPRRVTPGGVNQVVVHGAVTVTRCLSLKYGCSVLKVHIALGLCYNTFLYLTEPVTVINCARVNTTGSSNELFCRACGIALSRLSDFLTYSAQVRRGRMAINM